MNTMDGLAILEVCKTQGEKVGSEQLTRELVMDRYMHGGWEYSFYLFNGDLRKIEAYNRVKIVEVMIDKDPA